MPSVALVAPIVAAALRHTLTLPFGLCLVLGTLATAAAAAGLAWWSRARLRDPAVQVGAIGGAVLGWLLLRLVQRGLWAPLGGEPVTVGGGDLGHHLHIAALLAGPMPRVYVGFTGWHATMEAFATLSSPGPGQMLLAGWAATRLGLVAALAALSAWTAGAVVRVVRAAPGPRAGAARASLAVALGVVVAGALLVAAMQRFGLAIWHYHPADGFVAHAHALAPTLLAALLWTWVPPGWPALIAAAVGVVLLRFTYGLNLPEQALALGILAAWQLRAAAPTPHWQRRLIAGAALAGFGLAIAAAALLSGSFAKPGGVMHPTLDDRMLLLAAATPAIAAAAALGLRRLALWLGAVLLVPLALAVLHACVPTLPREYYLWKHGVAAEWVAMCALPIVAGAAAARLVHAPTRAGAAWALGLALMAWTFPGALADANPRMMASFRERATVGHRLHVTQPARDRSFEAVMAQIRDAGGHITAAMHPHWSSSSIWQTEVEGWDDLIAAPVVGLQDRRWAAFRDGPSAEPAGCVVIAAGRHRVAAWRTHRRRNHGAAGELALRWLEASDLRCVDGPRPRRWTWRERTCWRCPPARAAADSPGAAR